MEESLVKSSPEKKKKNRRQDEAKLHRNSLRQKVEIKCPLQGLEIFSPDVQKKRQKRTWGTRMEEDKRRLPVCRDSYVIIEDLLNWADQTTVY